MFTYIFKITFLLSHSADPFLIKFLGQSIFLLLARRLLSKFCGGVDDKNNNTSWNTVGIDLSCHWPWPNLKATNCEPNIFVSFQVASVGVYLPNQSIPLRLSHHIVSRSSFIIHSRYNIHTPSDRQTHPRPVLTLRRHPGTHEESEKQSYIMKYLSSSLP